MTRNKRRFAIPSANFYRGRGLRHGPSTRPKLWTGIRAAEPSFAANATDRAQRSGLRDEPGKIGVACDRPA
jgi:hypothetical protein